MPPIFNAFSCGIFFAILISFADALSERILFAFYSKERKKIKNKWIYVFSGRSKCDHCHQSILSVYLIPIVGYFLSGGQCSKCGGLLNKKYPVEEFFAFIFGFILYFSHTGISYLVFSAVYFLCIYIASRVDWLYMLIPTEIILILLVTAVTEFFQFQGGINFKINTDQTLTLTIAVLWYLLLHLIRMLSGYQLGLADVRLTLALSLALPWQKALLLITLASALGIMYYLLYIRRKYSKFTDSGLKTRIPFGIFIGLAFLILRVV